MLLYSQTEEGKLVRQMVVTRWTSRVGSTRIKIYARINFSSQGVRSQYWI